MTIATFLLAVEPVTTGIVVLAIIGFIAALAGGKKGAGAPEIPGGGGGSGGGTGTEPGGGGGGGGGGTTKPKGSVPDNIPKDPSHLGGGGAWGDFTKIPANFNWNGNGWWIAPDCTAIAVGKAFAPEDYTLMGFCARRDSISTLQSVTQLGAPPPKTGTLWNFLYHVYLTDASTTQPEDFTARVFAEMSLYCSQLPDDVWPQGLTDFYQALTEDVLTWYENDYEELTADEFAQIKNILC